jgi:hypothetical protein
MKLLDIVWRLLALRYLRASSSRIRQAGNSQKEQTYYNYFS